jgi:hypothetical protein
METTKPKRYCTCPGVENFRAAFRRPGFICFQCTLEVRMDYKDIIREELPMIRRRVYPC